MRDALALGALALLGACSDGTGPGSGKATISGIVTVAGDARAGSAAAGVVASASDAVSGRLPSLQTLRFAMPSRAFAEAPDQLIVTFRPADVGAPPIGARALVAPDAARRVAAAIRSRLATHALAGRAEIAGVSPTIVAARIRVPAHARLAEVAAELRSDAAIAVVEPNRLARLDADDASMSAQGAIAPGDFLYPVQAWHYGMLDLPRAWAITTGSPAVLVAVVDDGIRFDHPDIAANLTADGYDFVSPDPIPLCGGTGSIDNAGDGDGYDPDPTIPASYGHGTTALAGRENACFSGSRPGNPGLYHTGCGGGADGKGDFEIFSLTTSIQAVGEGNYGRLGPTQQQRYTGALAEPMFAEPATGGTPDEQPGAMPEIFPSAPDGDPSKGVPPNIDRCWTCRSMFMQAWGNYGTAWSVIHQQLGITPFVEDSELDVVPQVPDGQPSVSGSDIRVGKGSATVFAAHSGSSYTTKVQLSGSPVGTLVIGHTLPRGSRPASVTLDGAPAHGYGTRTTNRGVEVTVPASASGQHTLVVTAA